MTEYCGRCAAPIKAYRVVAPRDGHVTTVWRHPEGSPMGPHAAVLGAWTPLPLAPLKSEEGPAPAKPPHPEPEVPRREAREEELCRGVRQMVAAAERAGWSTGAMYARGTAPRGGDPLDSVAVRFYPAGSDKPAAVAVWENDKMALVYKLGPLEKINAKVLRKMFTEDEEATDGQ